MGGLVVIDARLALFREPDEPMPPCRQLILVAHYVRPAPSSLRRQLNSH